MTKQEAEQMLERLRQIFPIVRLLEETDVPKNREDIHPGGAEDGEKAIEQLHEYGKGISLVLLDLLMPVMDGFDVLAYMGTNKWLED